MIVNTLFIVAAFTLIATSGSTNYCNRNLCKKYTSNGRYYYYVNHIACGNQGRFSFECPRERSVVPMSRRLINLILEEHNVWRSNIASGRIRRYDEASQMIEMSWDTELARIAELNAKTCTFKHDDCRNTDKYRYVGQNIAIMRSSGDYSDVQDTVKELLEGWFMEGSGGRMSYMNRFIQDSSNIGHFAQIVKADADRIGCAITKFDNGQRNIYLVCNYSSSTMLGMPVYKTGAACSECTSGCSYTYPGLCNTNEKQYIKYI